MSMTLNLIDILLTTGRQLFTMGRFTEALTPLTKLSAFRKLPEPVREEIQSLLAEIYLQQKDYKNARRHLAAAIAQSPHKAEYCYLMAIAIEEDADADHARAETHFARAVELEPEQPTYWADFGSYLFSVGKTREALKAIRKAYTLGIADAEIVGEVAEVLRREELFDEATAKVRAALFHNHGATSFRTLWQKHQFAMIHAQQQTKHPKPQDERRDSWGFCAIILPFVAAPQRGKYLELGSKTFRIDQAQTLDEPKQKESLPFRRPPKKG